LRAKHRRFALDDVRREDGGSKVATVIADAPKAAVHKLAPASNERGEQKRNSVDPAFFSIVV
jgi:hypothetical protein